MQILIDLSALLLCMRERERKKREREREKEQKGQNNTPIISRLSSVADSLSRKEHRKKVRGAGLQFASEEPRDAITSDTDEREEGCRRTGRVKRAAGDRQGGRKVN